MGKVVFVVCIPLLIKSGSYFDFPQGPIPGNLTHCAPGGGGVAGSIQ